MGQTILVYTRLMVNARKQFLLAVVRHFLWAVTLTAFAFAVLSLLLVDQKALLISLPVAIVLFGWLFFGRARTKSERAVVGWRAIWLMVLAYGAFGLFFWHRHLALTSVDTSHIVAKQAFTLMVATLLLCLGYYVARLHPILRASGKSITGVLKLLVAFLPFLLVVWRSSQDNLPSWCHFAGLENSDWLVVSLLTTVFILLLELQERTTQHARHTLITKHGHHTVKKHLPTKRRRKQK